jgi:nucleolar GTP-binding protein
VKELACERLLSQRVEQKLKHGKKTNDLLNRLHLATPKPRDSNARPPTIPKSVVRARIKKADEEMKENGKEEEDEDDEEIPEEDQEDEDMERDYDSDYNSDEDKPEFMKGLNSLDWQRKYKLKNPDWRFDNIPEIVDGHNIADFIDPDILARLEELEREEEEREAELLENPLETYELDDETKETVHAIKQRRKVLVNRSREKKIGYPVPKTSKEGHIEDFETHLTEMGIDPTSALARARSRSRSQSRVARKRSRSQSAADKEDAKMAREHSHSRSVSKSAGFKNIEQKQKTEKLVKLQLRRRGNMAIRGEADRVVLSEKPKHLFTGKRSSGKTERR